LNGKTQDTRQAFQFAIHGRTFERAALVANRGLLPAMVTIFFDHFCRDAFQYVFPEEHHQMFDSWRRLRKG
jgi:hypothetical protein